MISEIIGSYKLKIEESLLENIDSFGSKSRLRDAIEYALKNGGKRFRPAIVLIIAEALGKNKDVTDAALAIEFFHTASLIADDLPCMDDDAFRRALPATHKAFDDATALLATYALISAGYDRIRLCAEKQHNSALCLLALQNAAFNTGIFGAVGGQYYDLFPGDLNESAAEDIMAKKTGTLFEISFVFGWLFGGGDIAELSLVKKAAQHFGLAFQISDDFLDLSQGKDKINYPTIVGEEKAYRKLKQEVDSSKEALKKLRLDSTELFSLINIIERRISQAAGAAAFS